jgi:hypothetical protein
MGVRIELGLATSAIALACGFTAAGSATESGPASPDVVLARSAPGRIYRAAFPGFGGPENHVTGARIHSFSGWRAGESGTSRR